MIPLLRINLESTCEVETRETMPTTTFPPAMHAYGLTPNMTGLHAGAGSVVSAALSGSALRWDMTLGAGLDG